MTAQVDRCEHGIYWHLRCEACESAADARLRESNADLLAALESICSNAEYIVGHRAAMVVNTAFVDAARAAIAKTYVTDSEWERDHGQERTQ